MGWKKVGGSGSKGRRDRQRDKEEGVAEKKEEDGGRGKVGGRNGSIECSNYSFNCVPNLGCHWFCISGLSTAEGLRRSN